MMFQQRSPDATSRNPAPRLGLSERADQGVDLVTAGRLQDIWRQEIWGSGARATGNRPYKAKQAALDRTPPASFTCCLSRGDTELAIRDHHRHRVALTVTTVTTALPPVTCWPETGSPTVDSALPSQTCNSITATFPLHYKRVINVLKRISRPRSQCQRKDSTQILTANNNDLWK